MLLRNGERKNKMKRKLPFIFAGIFLLILFILFSYSVQKNLFTAFDFDTTVKLQDRIPRKLDTPFSLFSLIGSFEIASVILLEY